MCRNLAKEMGLKSTRQWDSMGMFDAIYVLAKKIQHDVGV